MFAQIYKGFGLHRFWNCLAAFDGAAVRVLSVLVAVLLMSVSFIPGDATARSDDEVYPVDATLLRAPAHRFSTPPVNVKRPVRLAIVKYVRPSPNEEIVPASVTALKQYFGEDRVQVAHLSLTELSEAIKRGDVDVFLSSAGFYRRLADEGVKSLVSAVSLSYPDPNHGEGTAIVAAADRSDIESLRDLKGGVLATSTPTAFTGLLVPYGEMMKQGIKVDGFFRETLYLGDDDAMETAPRHLLDGTADVAFLRLCFLEEWLERHPEHQGRFKVINRKDGPGEVCARSTELYPTWTVGTTKVTDPRVSRSVTQALLALKPTGANGIYWGVATDYSSVDKLFRETRTGPYAYLNTWSLKRFIAEYWHWLMLAGVLVAGLTLHSVRVTQLVHKRTAALRQSLAELQVLKEEAQGAAQRIERLERAGVVAQLSVIFAHEMRQPLGAISLYSFGLRRMLGNGSTDTARMTDVIDRLDRQTERANEIVARVRSYAKAEQPPPRPRKPARAGRQGGGRPQDHGTLQHGAQGHRHRRARRDGRSSRDGARCTQPHEECARGVRRRGRRGRGRGDALRGGRTRDHHRGRRRRRDARDRRAPQQRTRLHEGRRARTRAFDCARHPRGLRRQARLQRTPSGRARGPRDRAREGGLRRAVAFG